MMEKQQEMQVQERLMDMQERMTYREEEREQRRDEQEKRREERDYQDWLKGQQNQSHAPHIPLPSIPPLHQQVAPTLPLPKIQPSVVPPSLPLQPSSPIDNNEDKLDLVSKFFDWVIYQQKPGPRKDDYTSAKGIAEQQYWGLDDLKNMANPSSDIYKIATEKYHIADGIV